jgi:hypothetical protein
MKKEDFFTIIVKLFGLYLFITTLFNIIPSNIPRWRKHSLVPQSDIELAARG